MVGLTLLEHLKHASAGTPEGKAIADLEAEVADDRRTLERLIARLGLGRSRPRQAAAWPTEKMTELKLKVDDPRGGALHRLESLEGLSLGIEGKRLLRRALEASGQAGLDGVNLDELRRRAADRRDRVETLRLATAGAAFATAGED